MKVPDGLLFFEYILLLLGVVLFFALLVILIIYVVRKQAIKPLLVFFALPIVMIGYPSIQKISFDQDGVKLEKKIKNVEENPGDDKAKADLEKELGNINDKRINTDKFKFELAKGSALVMDSASVNKYLRSVDIKSPQEERKAEDIKSLMRTRGGI